MKILLMQENIKNKIILGVSVGITLFLVINLMIMVKIYTSSIDEFNKGEIAYGQSDYKKAAKHYERSIIWYYPYITPLFKSIDRTIEIASIYTKQKNTQNAITTFRKLKSALYSINSLYSPAINQIEQTEAAIKSLQSERSAALQKLPSPWQKVQSRSSWALLAGAGLIGWIFSTIYFIYGWKNHKSFAGIAIHVGMIALSYSIWLLGLKNA